MILRKWVVIILFYIPCSYGQLTEPVETGYTNLTIKIKGSFPKKITPPKAHYSNPLLFDMPVNFEEVNDSTFLLSFYTYGPSPVYFNFGKQYLHAILLPNKPAVINIDYSSPESFVLSFTGAYEKVFYASETFALKIEESFDQRIMPDPEDYTFENPISYRKLIEEKIAQRVDKLTDDLEDPEIRRYIGQSLAGVYRQSFLLSDEYKFRLYQHNKGMGLDSAEAEKRIPKLTKEYFYPILEDAGDSGFLAISSYQKLLSGFITDTTVSLPQIEREGIPAFLEALSELTQGWKEAPADYFLELMVAKGFSDFISKGGLLNDQHKAEILNYFANQSLSNYLLYRNEQNTLPRAERTGQYYLPYEDTFKNVMERILAKYKGKVIVMDFWATWCGPCLEAHQDMEKVKENYAGRADVVFLYMTDESSDYGRWKEYITTLGGEHYYLYKHQFVKITENYDFRYLPTYLIFNTEGELSTLETFPENIEKEAVKWIEKALNKSA